MTPFPSVRLKYLAHVNPDALSETTDPDYEFRYIDIGNVTSDGRIAGAERLTFKNAPSRARRLVNNGDVIVSTVRTYLQAIAPINFESDGLVVSTGFAVVRPRVRRLDAGYAKYALRETSFVAEVMNRSVGVSYPAINATDLNDITVPVPSLETQRRIARHLDRELSEIDQLIAAKKRLLSLLAEKRRAAITHAVTNRFRLQFDRYQRLRLDGEVDYPVIPLKYVASISGGATPNRGQRDNWGGDIPWVSPKDMKTTAILDSQEHITELGLRVASLDLLSEKHLLLVVRGMILAHTLPVALNSVPVTINQDMRAIAFDDSILPDFALLYFQGFSSWLLTQVTESAHGTKKLDTEVIREMPIVRFPLSVQEAIVNDVARETTTISQMEDVTRKTIHLLMERRAALISAAVTGQISTAGAHE